MLLTESRNELAQLERVWAIDEDDLDVSAQIASGSFGVVNIGHLGSLSFHTPTFPLLTPARTTRLLTPARALSSQSSSGVPRAVERARRGGEEDAHLAGGGHDVGRV